MFKLVKLYNRDGPLPMIDAVLSRLHSKTISLQHGYPKDFLIGTGTYWRTGPFAEIGKQVRIGRRCRIETIDSHNSQKYSPRLIIGDHVSINDDVHIGCAHHVVIGENSLLASKIFIADHNHGAYRGPYADSPLSAPNDRPLEVRSVVIGRNVWIGEMVIVLPGVTIGQGSVIGAGSVVTRSLPDYCIAVGAPAKVVKLFNFKNGKWEKSDEE